jgi:hypothetical protein
MVDAELEESYWLSVYTYGLLVLFFMDTIGFVLMLYLIIRKSTGMAKYKWYLLLNFTLSYAFSVGNLLWEPMPLLENVVAMYFNGILKNYGMIGFNMLINLYICIAAAYPFTMLYRFLQVEKI